ncbi:MAG: tetratricopeptide repeat protein, partial [Pseudomonadota bacterium]
QDKDPLACAAEAAAQLGDLPRAIRELESASQLAPDDLDVAELLLRLYSMELADLANAERLDGAIALLATVEKHADRIRQRWGTRESIESLVSRAYSMLGEGYYNAGEIARAAAFFERAKSLGLPAADALEKLATIELKRGNAAQAVRGFRNAVKVPRTNPLEDKSERAHLLRLLGEALAKSGDAKSAIDAWHEALGVFGQVLRQRRLPGHQRAYLLTEKARVLYNLGRRDEARIAFEQAVDTNQDDAGVYTNMIAFLLARGHFEPALDAYHRALGRATVTEYFKVYTALWVVHFARIRGKTPDPLASGYLASRTGKQWYCMLARFAVGSLGYDELLGMADTRGKRAEAFFYQAMTHLARGERRQAKKFLRLVVATDMLGFFEYDMATYFLENGLHG